MQLLYCPATVRLPRAKSDLFLWSNLPAEVHLYFISLTASLLLSLNVLSVELETIIVSSKTDSQSSSLAQTHTVITQEQIEENNFESVESMFAQTWGVDFSKTGMVGGQSAIYIRGSEARHVSIVVDGVKVYDPTTISRDFDLGLLDISQIEKVEVLKGSHSVLYGSDAIGGVIYIQTKKGSPKSNISLKVGLENKASVIQNVPLGHSSLLSVSAFYSESTPINIIEFGTEKDKALSQGIDLNLLYSQAKLESNTLLKFNQTRDDLDGSDFDLGRPIDIDGDYSKKYQILLSQNLNLKLDSKQSLSFNISSQHTQRHTESTSRSSGVNSLTLTDYTGTVGELEMKYLLKQNTYQLILGFDEVHETYLDQDISQKNLKSQAIYSEVRFKKKNWITSIGGRQTYSRDFDQNFVYEVSEKYEHSDGRFISIIHATGFKAPTTYQLYAPVGIYGPVGNSDLKPEKSKSYEIVIGKKMTDTSLEASFFYSEIENFVNYGSSGYDNSGQIIAQGSEISFLRKLKQSTIGANLLMINHSKASGKDAQRRANFTFKSFYKYELSSNTNLKLNYSRVGRRFEYILGKREELKDYSLIDLSYQKKYLNHEFVLSLNNILNENYELARYYSVPDRNLSLQYRFNY